MPQRRKLKSPNHSGPDKVMQNAMQVERIRGWRRDKKKPLRPDTGTEGLGDLPGAGQYIPPIPPGGMAEAFSFSGSS